MKTTSITFLKWIIKQISNPRRRQPYRRLSQKQRHFRDRFGLATAYAKKQIADAETRALYSTGISKKLKSAYAVAFRDALTPPVVASIDACEYYGAVGDIIRINAFDDFRVTRLRVVITNRHGQELERGNAVGHPGNLFLWIYKATVRNTDFHGTKITATAFDFPGNEGTAEEVLTDNYQCHEQE
jgi:hypothetical protein